MQNIEDRIWQIYRISRTRDWNISLTRQLSMPAQSTGEEDYNANILKTCLRDFEKYNNI